MGTGRWQAYANDYISSSYSLSFGGRSLASIIHINEYLNEKHRNINRSRHRN